MPPTGGVFGGILLKGEGVDLWNSLIIFPSSSKIIWVKAASGRGVDWGIVGCRQITGRSYSGERAGGIGGDQLPG